VAADAYDGVLQFAELETVVQDIIERTAGTVTRVTAAAKVNRKIHADGCRYTRAARHERLWGHGKMLIGSNPPRLPVSTAVIRRKPLVQRRHVLTAPCQRHSDRRQCGRGRWRVIGKCQRRRDDRALRARRWRAHVR